MEWKDLEKMTVVKLREEALKFPQIEGVHGKSKERLMDELAVILNMDRPQRYLNDQVVHTKSDLKHKIHDLKIERERLQANRDYDHLHDVRRQIHELKHTIRKLETKAG